MLSRIPLLACRSSRLPSRFLCTRVSASNGRNPPLSDYDSPPQHKESLSAPELMNSSDKFLRGPRSTTRSEESLSKIIKSNLEFADRSAEPGLIKKDGVEGDNRSRPPLQDKLVNMPKPFNYIPELLTMAVSAATLWVLLKMISQNNKIAALIEKLQRTAEKKEDTSRKLYDVIMSVKGMGVLGLLFGKK